MVWDCAAGSGQATRPLAERFGRVVATDASAAQLAAGSFPANSMRWVARAEASGLRGASCDAVCVAQALHWFDIPRFHAEADRVLRPGGLLVAWGYGLHQVGPGIDALLREFHDDLLGDSWPPERAHILRRYEDLPWPGEALEVPAAMEMEVDWELGQLLGYLSSWSSVQRHREAGRGEALDWLRPRLREAWGDPGRSRRVRWPLFVLARRRRALP